MYISFFIKAVKTKKLATYSNGLLRASSVFGNMREYIRTGWVLIFEPLFNMKCKDEYITHSWLENTTNRC